MLDTVTSTTSLEGGRARPFFLGLRHSLLEAIIATTFTNGRVTLRDDLVFGTVVLTTTGWLPITELDADHIKHIQRLLDYNPTCPQRFFEALRKQLDECMEKYAFCGARVVDPCDEPPPDTCERALNATYHKESKMR